MYRKYFILNLLLDFIITNICITTKLTIPLTLYSTTSTHVYNAICASVY